KLWKHLRDRFVKEKKKFPSGAGAPISNWVHFDAMLFYNKFTKKRKTFTATKKTPISRPSSSASVWSTVTMESVTSPESRTESPLEEATSPGNFTEEEEQPVADPSGIKRKLPTGRTPTTPIGVQGRKKKLTRRKNWTKFWEWLSQSLLFLEIGRPFPVTQTARLCSTCMKS
ncbi:unnamed protein product, partial [Phaedon cochleariae]